jgi:hypothetical protein
MDIRSGNGDNDPPANTRTYEPSFRLQQSLGPGATHRAPDTLTYNHTSTGPACFELIPGVPF